MRSYQLRIFSLRSEEALAQYVEQYVDMIYPRHLESMPLFGVELYGFWTKRDDERPRLFALVSYAEGDDPDKVDRRFMQSSELAEDIKGFDMGEITGVDTTILDRAIGSPLQ